MFTTLHLVVIIWQSILSSETPSQGGPNTKWNWSGFVQRSIWWLRHRMTSFGNSGWSWFMSAKIKIIIITTLFTKGTLSNSIILEEIKINLVNSYVELIYCTYVWESKNVLLETPSILQNAWIYSFSTISSYLLFSAFLASYSYYYGLFLKFRIL